MAVIEPDTVDNIDAFSAPEHAESVCRELFGCLCWLNDVYWCSIIVFTSLVHLWLVSVSVKQLTCLGKQHCVHLFRRLPSSSRYHSWHLGVFTLSDGCAPIVGLISGKLPKEIRAGRLVLPVSVWGWHFHSAAFNPFTWHEKRKWHQWTHQPRQKSMGENSESSYNAAPLILHSFLCSAVTRSIVCSSGRKQLLNCRSWCGSCREVWWSSRKECCNLNTINAYDNIFTAL